MTATARYRILVWHVHGSWMNSFVRGGHHYLVPTNPEGDEWGRGRAGRPWPDDVVECPVAELAEADFDLVVLQRPEEIELVAELTGRRPGIDCPAVYLEHNTPTGHAARSLHPLAHRSDIPVVHVTGFNALMWDCGAAPTTIVEHGVVDPGYLYTGVCDRAATMINEPVRRRRIVGTDLLGELARTVPIDVFGIGTNELAGDFGSGEVVGRGDLPLDAVHAEIARRRVYVHTARWTSLGLSLIEAMQLGMPVVVVGTTEAFRAVPAGAGVVSCDVDVLAGAVADFAADAELARLTGKRAREWALHHYGLDRFIDSWDDVMADLCSAAPGSNPAGSDLAGSNLAEVSFR